MWQIAECLSRGELVGSSANRPAAPRDDHVPLFRARMPSFPRAAALALSLRAPVYLVAACTRAASATSFTWNRSAKSRVQTAPKGSRVREWVQRYAERLEHSAARALQLVQLPIILEQVSALGSQARRRCCSLPARFGLRRRRSLGLRTADGGSSPRCRRPRPGIPRSGASRCCKNPCTSGTCAMNVLR